MGLKNEQFEKGELKKYLGKPKAGEHKWFEENDEPIYSQTSKGHK